MNLKKTFKHVVVAISFGVLLLPMAAFSGNGKKQANPTGQGMIMAEILFSLPYEELSTDEINGLNLMREEEKLARDVYQYLYSEWGLMIFKKISTSEQRHMDAVGFLLDKYGLDDPAENNPPGIFTSPVLQVLYDDLIADGSVSQVAALEVGATIEDLDIFDLLVLLDQADNEDIKTAYQNLLKGSRNHLRSFVYQLSLNGVDYVAEYLTDEEIESIILTPYERGVYNQDGEVVYEPVTRMGAGGRRR